MDTLIVEQAQTGDRLTGPRRPARVRRGVWVGLGACASAAALLLSVAAHRVAYFPGDLQIMRSLQAADLSALDPVLHVLNALGFPPLVGVAYGGVIVACFVAGLRWEAASAAIAALGGAGLNRFVKALVDRPRPSDALVHVEHHVTNPSYPAGHVLNLTAFAGFLCCVVYVRSRPSWRRSGSIALMLALIALMGVARVHSGEHWPSDVLGGYLLGTAWLAVVLLVYEWGRRRFASAHARASGPRAAHVLAVALLLAAPATFAGSACAAPGDFDSLAASSEVPWNPPQPLARRMGWERGVLLPGRIVSLPLTGLGFAADRMFMALEQHPRLSMVTSHPLGSGRGSLAFGTAHMGGPSGLGGSVTVRRDLLHESLKSRVSAEYAATHHLYNRSVLTWTGRPLSLQYGYEWRPQDRFYGIGNHTSEDSVSDFASQREFVRGGITWASDRYGRPSRIRRALGAWAGPRSQVMRTGRQGGFVSYQARFPVLGAATLNRRVEHLVYGASLKLDQRTGSPHWSHGWRTLVSAERFDAPLPALALHSGAERGARFTRYQAEAEGGLSFMRDPRTVRMLVRVVDQQVDSHGERMLIDDLSILGGSPGLGGYPSGRFHDLDLLLTRATYVFPLSRRLEMDLHSEWGAVYPDLWKHVSLGSLHHSAGFALRMRSDLAPNGSIGLDFSSEAIRFRFSFGGVE